jgi:hypothetical protein
MVKNQMVQASDNKISGFLKFKYQDEKILTEISEGNIFKWKSSYKKYNIKNVSQLNNFLKDISYQYLIE